MSLQRYPRYSVNNPPSIIRNEEDKVLRSLKSFLASLSNKMIFTWSQNLYQYNRMMIIYQFLWTFLDLPSLHIIFMHQQNNSNSQITKSSSSAHLKLSKLMNEYCIHIHNPDNYLPMDNYKDYININTLQYYLNGKDVYKQELENRFTRHNSNMNEYEINRILLTFDIFWMQYVFFKIPDITELDFISINQRQITKYVYDFIQILIASNSMTILQKVLIRLKEFDAMFLLRASRHIFVHPWLQCAVERNNFGDVFRIWLKYIDHGFDAEELRIFTDSFCNFVELFELHIDVDDQIDFNPFGWKLWKNREWRAKVMMLLQNYYFCCTQVVYTTKLEIHHRYDQSVERSLLFLCVMLIMYMISSFIC